MMRIEFLAFDDSVLRLNGSVNLIMMIQLLTSIDEKMLFSGILILM